MGSDVTYPDVTVMLTDEDGNAFNLIGLTVREIRKVHGHGAADAFAHQAKESTSYEGLLAFIQATVHVR